jgi:hypothetical protein
MVAWLCFRFSHPRFEEQVTAAWHSLRPWAHCAADVGFWAEIGVLWAGCSPAVSADELPQHLSAVIALQARATTAEEHSALVDLAAAIASLASTSGAHEPSLGAATMGLVADLVEKWTAAGGDPAAKWVDSLEALFVGEQDDRAARSLLRALESAEVLDGWKSTPVARQRRLIRGKLHLMLTLCQRVAATRLLIDAMGRPHPSDRESLTEWIVFACNLVHALRSCATGGRHVERLALAVHEWLDGLKEDASLAADVEAMRGWFHDDADEPEPAARCWGEAARWALADGRIGAAMESMDRQWVCYSMLVDEDEARSEDWIELKRRLCANAWGLAQEHHLREEIARWGLRRARELIGDRTPPHREAEVRQLLQQIEAALHACDSSESRQAWLSACADIWRTLGGHPANQAMS